MPKKKSKSRGVESWIAFTGRLQESVPHLASWFSDEEEFSELRLKARDDGTVLAIAKGYSPDGGPVVCFGAGYGVAAALMAVDATIQGGHWKVDKPWSPSNG